MQEIWWLLFQQYICKKFVSIAPLILKLRMGVQRRTELDKGRVNPLVGSTDGSGRVGSGRVGSGRVGSGRVGSGRVGSGRVGSGRVGSGPDFCEFRRVRSVQEI
jgi:hypothetical protein